MSHLWSGKGHHRVRTVGPLRVLRRRVRIPARRQIDGNHRRIHRYNHLAQHSRLVHERLVQPRFETVEQIEKARDRAGLVILVSVPVLTRLRLDDDLDDPDEDDDEDDDFDEDGDKKDGDDDEDDEDDQEDDEDDDVETWQV